MRFQPGQSGNPAGRPPGSLNKKTLALQEAFEAKGEEIVDDVIARAKNGQPAAMRLLMERLVPTGRNRRFAIDLPVVKTPEDAEAAVAVVLAELAAGKLAVHEVSSLIPLIDRMLRLAERMWKMKEAQRERQEAEALGKSAGAVYAAALAADTAAETPVPEAAAAAKSARKGGERLYSPVNQETRGGAERSPARADGPPASGARGTPPQAKAA
jgi:hypothetical protein